MVDVLFDILVLICFIGFLSDFVSSIRRTLL